MLTRFLLNILVIGQKGCVRMPPLNLLIKPASSLCNLRCMYCFYHSIAENREIESYGVMSLDTLETLVKKALEYADGLCTFAFQGGEPTIAGLPFFEKLIEYQTKYNTKNVQINNAIQTNGILINEKWAKFLAENNFLVGLSLDGPKDIHDANRINASGKGTFLKVMETAALFNKFKVEYNILFVVSSNVSRHAAKIYNFFKKNDFRYLQFIPCLDPLDGKPGDYPFSLTPEKFTTFIITLFDLWYNDIMADNYFSIRWFDNLAGMLMGYPPELCGMRGQCQCQFVVEADGSVFPCDFYVIDRWKMGNLLESGFDELLKSSTAQRFMKISHPVDDKCKECRHYMLCRGGCRRNREPFIDDKPALNYLCPAYIKFFDHAMEKLENVARKFSAKR